MKILWAITKAGRSLSNCQKSIQFGEYWFNSLAIKRDVKKTTTNFTYLMIQTVHILARARVLNLWSQRHQESKALADCPKDSVSRERLGRNTKPRHLMPLHNSRVWHGKRQRTAHTNGEKHREMCKPWSPWTGITPRCHCWVRAAPGRWHRTERWWLLCTQEFRVWNLLHSPPRAHTGPRGDRVN